MVTWAVSMDMTFRDIPVFWPCASMLIESWIVVRWSLQRVTYAVSPSESLYLRWVIPTDNKQRDTVATMVSVKAFYKMDTKMRGGEIYLLSANTLNNLKCTWWHSTLSIIGTYLQSWAALLVLMILLPFYFPLLFEWCKIVLQNSKFIPSKAMLNWRVISVVGECIFIVRLSI